MSEDLPKPQSPATAILLSLLIVAIVVGVLAWPWPRLCFDDPSFYNCNPLLWLKRAMDRVLGN